MKKKLEPQVGDLVKCNGIWNGMVGIVKATYETGWYVAKGMVDVSDCLVDIKDCKILKRNFLPKKYRPYFK